jgi:hypothetical protein
MKRHDSSSCDKKAVDTPFITFIVSQIFRMGAIIHGLYRAIRAKAGMKTASLHT